MGKKQKNSQAPQSNNKIKHIKSNKIRNKQMFTELKTHEQNKIQKSTRNRPTNPITQQMINEQDENSYDNNNIQLNPQQNSNIEQVCTIVHNLITKNKISAKNAFEVPFIDLQKLQDFSRISQSENGWRKISSTLENDSKIYSFRVDAIHSIAYKIMNTMTRNQDQTVQNKQDNSKELTKQNQIDKIAFPIVDQFDVSVGLQLEKNVQNINMQSLDKYANFNPTYERTRRRFDQNGLKGMLLNNIQVDNNLQLSLNQTRLSRSSGFFSQAIPVKVDRLCERLDIFKSAQNTRKAVSNLTQEQFIFSTGMEQNWRKMLHGQFTYQKMNPENDQNQMMEQQVQQPKYQSVLRKVQDAIKLKNKPKTVLKNMNDVAQDGSNWLSDMDKKMLGIYLPNSNTSTLKKLPSASTKIQRNQDDIDFKGKMIQKFDVFSQQTMQRQKQEYNQQIEQKHLLPIRLFHKFKVEQIMTLRQQPAENFISNDQINENENEIKLEIERDQVDIKRQQISIRQSKQKLKTILSKQTDFKGLCKKFQIAQRNIGPQLCFLTVLHLANQNNLRLQQIDDYNFKIGQ